MRTVFTSSITTWVVAALTGWALCACSVAPDDSKLTGGNRKLAIKDSTVRDGGDRTDADATIGGSNSQESKSFDLFKSTVYDLAQNCASCHATATAPKFAAKDPLLAFTELTEASKVNLQDPASSRLVLRLSDDLHNCWSDCEKDAQAMLAAIETWAAGLENEEGDASFNFMSESLTFAEAIGQAKSNPLQKGIIAYEMEDATLKTPFSVVVDAGATIVTSTEGGGVAATPEEAAAAAELGNISVAFDADENWPAWEVYVRVQAPDQNGNTVFFQMDDMPMEQWEIQPTGAAFAYRKIQIAGSGDRRFQLFKGKHTLKFVQGEDNIKFDKIVISRVIVPDLEAIQTTSMKSTVFYYDLSKHVGGLDVGISITIDDFDATAYLFHDFVLVNNSGKTVSIQGLYPVINNTYLPNHSAWSKAKVLTAEPVSEFASNSTTVLKDTGTASDKIQLGFDEITVVD